MTNGCKHLVKPWTHLRITLRFDSRVFVCVTDADKPVPALKSLIQLLPVKQRSLLTYLVQFLHTLLNHSKRNGTTAEKLGKAFGIFLLRPQGFRPEGGKKASMVVTAILGHAEELLSL